MTAEQALVEVVPKASALLVVTMGEARPARRLDTTPFLTVAPDVPLPTRGVNVAATLLEQVLGRSLFPLHIEAVDMPSSFMAQQGLLAGLNPSRRLPPVAIWEVGSGRVMVDRRLVAGTSFWGDAKVQHMFDSMATQMFTALTSALRATSAAYMGSSSSSTATTTTAGASHGSQQSAGASSSSSSYLWPWRREDLGSLLGPALALAVSAAFATAPPLWFCVVCPAVLGLLAPLLINIGLNQLAGWICVHYSLPDDQCFDLLLGALGLGFVLALASAIPIFFVCRLQECANRGGLQRLQPRALCGGGGVWQWLGGRKMGGVLLVDPLSATATSR